MTKNELLEHAETVLTRLLARLDNLPDAEDAVTERQRDTIGRRYEWTIFCGENSQHDCQRENAQSVSRLATAHRMAKHPH